MRRALLSVLVALLACLPELASACAVCTSGRDYETRDAFLWTTLFLSVLPIALVGGLVLWIRRRSRAVDAAETHRVARHAGTPAPEAPAARASLTP